MRMKCLENSPGNDSYGLLRLKGLKFLSLFVNFPEFM
jgi:hypothetical protein